MSIYFRKARILFRHLYSLDKWVLLPLVALAVINLFLQYSANDQDVHRLFNDGLYLILSFAFLFVIASLNVTHFKSVAKPFYIVSILLLIAVLFAGVSVNGARRWLNIGFRIQPSELCKLSVPLIMAYYLSLKNDNLIATDYLITGLLLLIPVILIVKQPDLGTGILVLASGFFVLFFAGLPWRSIIIGVVIFLCLTPIIWHLLHPYQQHRILTLLNPSSDPLGKGYHIIQGIIAIGSGGMWGKGYLHGTQIHLNFIPEKHTDFVVTVLAEEFGYVGIIVVMMLYLLLILRGLKIMQNANDIFSKTITGSIVLSFMLYILINMGMVAGILPVVGVPLPFISYGGTATIVLMASFGILLAIARHNKY